MRVGWWKKGTVGGAVAVLVVVAVASVSTGQEREEATTERLPVPRDVRSLGELVQCRAVEGYVVLGTDDAATAPGEPSVDAAMRRYLDARFAEPPGGGVASRPPGPGSAIGLVQVPDQPWVVAHDGTGAVAAFQTSRLPGGGTVVTTAVICDSALEGPFRPRRQP